MEGLDGQMDVYRFYTSYLPNDNDVEVVLILDGGVMNTAILFFSKVHGSGRVTVLGFDFSNWYDDEALMLANAVQYTAGSGGFGIDVTSGTVLPDSSVDIHMFHTLPLIWWVRLMKPYDYFQ